MKAKKLMLFNNDSSPAEKLNASIIIENIKTWLS
jgi:hypothetical protein